MLRDMGLQEDSRLRGIYAACYVEGCNFEGSSPEINRIDGLWNRDSVEVDNAKDIFESVLVLNPDANRADVVADVQFACGLDA